MSIFDDSVIVSPSSAIMRPVPADTLLKANVPKVSIPDNIALPLPMFVPD